jgi:hypothetical protein
MKTLRKQVRSAMRIRSLCLVPALLLVPIAVRADYFIDGEGKGQAFCEAILTALNKSKPTQEKRPCISEEILKLPGVTDPAWEKLDLSQHEELAKKLYVLNSVGSQEYFRSQKLMPQMYPSPEQQQRFVGNRKRLGADLFALHMPEELAGHRVLVTLRYKNELCGSPARQRGESSDSAWVNPDLKEIATGPGLFDSRAARPLMYRGRLYLVRPYGTDDALEVFVPRSATLIRACNIGFTSGTTFKGEKK